MPPLSRGEGSRLQVVPTRRIVGVHRVSTGDRRNRSQWVADQIEELVRNALAQRL